MQKNRIYLIGIIIVLSLVTINGWIGVSIAKAQDDTTTPIPTVEPAETEPPEDVEGIQFLDSVALLLFKYEDLQKGQKIQVSVLNNSSKNITISGEVTVLNVVEAQDEQLPQPIMLDFGDVSCVDNSTCEIEPGAIAILEFQLNVPDDQSDVPVKKPADDTYNGFIILSAFDGGDLVNVIQRTFTLQVGKKQEDPFDPENLTITSSIEDLNYELRDLESGEQQISVLIENKAKKSVTVNVTIDFPGIETQPFSDTFLNPLPNEQETLLVVRLTKKTYFVESGDYDGHLKLTFKDGFKIIKEEYIPIKLTVSSYDTGINQVVNWIQIWPQRWFSFKLGPFEWVVLAVIPLLLIIFIRRRPGIPGTIAITLTDQTGNVKAEAEKAVMQERLAKAGILPQTSVPGGSMGENLIAVLEQTEPISAASWITPLLKLFQDAFKRKPDHSVNGTFIVREDKPQKGLTIELSDARTGRIEEIKTFWKETHREAVESAAYFVHQRISHQPNVLRRIPVWARFPSARVFEQYHCGLRLEEAGKFDYDAGKLAGAKKLYLDAATAAPNNATIRFRLGNLMENQHEFLDAMEYYLEIVSIWPDQYKAHYRLGVVCSFHKELKEEWEKGTVGNERRENLKALIKSELDENRAKGFLKNGEGPEFPQNNQNNALEKYFNELAKARWKILKNMIIYRENTWRAEKVQQFMYRILSIESVTNLRNPCIHNEKELEKNQDFINAKSVIEHLLAKDPYWQIRYNAACFYSIAIGKTINENEKEKFEKNAISQLLSIVKDPQEDPENQTPFDWMVNETYGDPDLVEVRKTKRFQALFGASPTPKKSAAQKEVEELCHSWDVLAAAAKKQEDIWLNRWTTVRTLASGKVKKEEIEPWINEELKLWSAVHAFAAAAEDESKRNAFWTEIKGFHTGAEDMPKLSMKCIENNLLKHLHAWNDLYTCALKHVEQIPQDTNAKNLDSADSQIEEWVFKQWALWQALRYWAGSPLEDALSLRFKKRINCSEKEIKDKLDARILNFFNSVIDAKDITSRIHDDPSYGKQSRQAYGIRLNVAEEILNNRPFKKLENLDKVKGIGPDTFRDILYSFLKLK